MRERASADAGKLINGVGPPVGKRAKTAEELSAEATKYVRERMYRKGGFWREAIHGLRHKTLPAVLRLESSLSFTKVAAIAARVFIMFGAGLLPILTRRAIVQGKAVDDGLDGFMHLLLNLSKTDYILFALGVAFLGLPKVFDTFRRRGAKPTEHPYVELFAAMRKMPPVEADADANATQMAVTHVLNALRFEMSALIGDEERKRLTDVTLLQFCGAGGSRMQVTARTAVGEPTHRQKDAHLFLANYVAREGNWFAEHDFCSRANPFKPSRLTVQGYQPVPYRSVLLLPILTSEGPRPLAAGEIGPVQDVVDSCIGVICVHSARPYRFWRWGDHRKANGSGFGNVAYERALPYIALISKLIERTALKVRVEGSHP